MIVEYPQISIDPNEGSDAASKVYRPNMVLASLDGWVNPRHDEVKRRVGGTGRTEFRPSNSSWPCLTRPSRAALWNCKMING